MRKNFSRIAVVLDTSGSMFDVKAATVSGFNEFLADQKREDGDALFSLTQFNDVVWETKYSLPIQQVQPLDAAGYTPGGNTALLDAMGHVIESIGRELSRMKEADRPDSVSIVVMTDGYENSSKFRTKEQIKRMVELQTNTYRWKFIYLGANQDAILTGEQYGFARGQTVTYAANAVGVANVAFAASNLVKQYRKGNDLSMFTDEDRANAMAGTPVTNTGSSS